MNTLLKKLLTGITLTGIGVSLAINSTKENPDNVVPFRQNYFSTTFLVDRNRDGECDETLCYLVGNRRMNIFHLEPTEKEKVYYREHKKI